MSAAAPRHFRESAAAAALFDSRVEKDPAGVVRTLLARGLRVDPCDLECPFTTQQAALPPSMRAHFGIQHALPLSQERQAMQLAKNAAALLGRRSDDAAAKASADLEQRIAARAAELEAHHWAELRAKWTAQARAELTPATSQTTTDTTTPRTKRTQERRIA